VPHYNEEDRSPVPYHLMNDMKTSNSISPTNSNRNSAASSDSGRGYSTGHGEPRVGTDSERDRIGGVMVGMLASSVVDRGFEPRSSQTKDYKIGICCFSTNHATLRRNSKDWLVRNQNNVSELSDMSTRPRTVVSVS